MLAPSSGAKHSSDALGPCKRKTELQMASGVETQKPFSRPQSAENRKETTDHKEKRVFQEHTRSVGSQAPKSHCFVSPAHVRCDSVACVCVIYMHDVDRGWQEQKHVYSLYCRLLLSVFISLCSLAILELTS